MRAPPRTRSSPNSRLVISPVSAQAVENARLPRDALWLLNPFNLLKRLKSLGAFARMDPRFAHIRDWIFDLDNCLYPASTGLFDADRRANGAPISSACSAVDPVEARRVQKAHFHEHGTTLAGLMKEHDVDPARFPGRRPRHPARPGRTATTGWRALLPRLPGRKFVFTNGDAPYARRVLDADRRRPSISTTSTTSMRASYRPKPDPHGYRASVRPVRDRSRRTRCWSTTWSRTSRRRKRSG